MATKAKRKDVSFDKAGMLGFPSVNDAVKYFSDPKNGGYSRKEVTALYEETFILNIGSLSMNMSYVLKNKSAFIRLIGDQMKNPARAELIEKTIDKWIKENGGKPVNIPVEVKDETITENDLIENNDFDTSTPTE